MDNLKSNNNSENAVASFEYAYPSETESEEPESNKSTPFYTPLEFLQKSFEFPSPKTETPMHYQVKADDALPLNNAISSSVDLDIYSSAPAAIFAMAATPKQLLPRSPSVNRKCKRFSLYDRRSCSPQHLGPRSNSLQSASSYEEQVDNSENLFIHNKENTMPKCVSEKRIDDGIQFLSNSGQNSPISLREDTSNDGNRLGYSPKLLASINNLNISGSPLCLINSAGYKNGNFFRFPEIDQVVQDCPCFEQPAVDACLDNQLRMLQMHQHIHDKIESTSPTTTASHHKFRQRSSELSGIANTPPLTDLVCRHQQQQQQRQVHVPPDEITEQRPHARLPRKNKNNLTIRIGKGSVKSPVPATVTPLPTKPKTPTIKEKARSLDSANVHDNELSIVIQNVNESHASFDEIDAQIPSERNADLRNSCAANLDACVHSTYRLTKQNPVNNYSTSLSQLDTQGASTSAMAAMNRLSRRKSPGLNNSDWMSHHRKLYPYNLPQNKKIESNTAQSSLDSDVFDYSSDSPQRSGSDLKSAATVDSTNKYGPTLLAAPAAAVPRGIHKHNQILHSSSTNLKTLPECLTLVEFSTANSPGPFKQKSMELPATHTTYRPHQPLIPARPASSSSSTNLLQRRGSNNSLSLALHNSCGNLMNSGGLSLSNYSLGSVNNFNSILNSKSTCNLDINAAIQMQGHPPPIYANNTNISQGSRQRLFRRGSNLCITFRGQPSATSCVDLNSLSQIQNAAAASGDQKYLLNCPSISRPSSSNVPSNAATPKRGILERRGSNQSFSINMNLIGSSSQHLGDTTSQKGGDTHQLMLMGDQVQLCNCAASQTSNQRKFFSTENLNANRCGTQQYYDYNGKQMFFGSASDLMPSEYSVESIAAPAHQEECMNMVVCTCAGVVRNIMTRPLSPQTTSEEFKIYLAGIQMLQSSTNTLNQFDLIKLNKVFDNSYNKPIMNLIDPPVLSVSRDGETPTGQQQTFTSEDSELQAIYQAIVDQIPSGSGMAQQDENEQKRIFCDLHKEFWDLPLNHQEKPMVFGSQTKNRYKTILPNEHSRVQLESEVQELRKLENIGLEALDVTSSNIGNEAKKTLVATEDAPYINANYIKGPDYVSKCYVATQGPMPNTIYDFWIMIYQNTTRYIKKDNDGGSSSSPHVGKHLILQQYYQKIIMLTNFTENNRQKCAVYFPIELNDILAVAARQEIFQLSSAVKEFFEPYLSSSMNGIASHNPFTSMGDANSTSIAVESCKVKLTDACLKELTAAGNNFFLVKNIGIVRRNGYSIRKFVILYCIYVPNTETNYHLQRIYCYHYWYPDWPDHQSPRDINTLLDTCLHVLNLGKCESEFDNYDDATTMRNAHLNAQRIELYKQDIFNAVQPLPVLHCSAGIGRTGCFTGILNAVRQLRQSLAYSLTAMSKLGMTEAAALQSKECSSSPIVTYDSDSSFTRNTLLHIKQIIYDDTLNSGETVSSSSSLFEQIIPAFNKLPKMPDIYVDILGIVCNLRLQRGGMVQNSEQYELLHRAVCLYLKRTLALRRF